MDAGAAAADVLRRCASGDLAPGVALVRLLIVYGDVQALRSALVAHAWESGTREAVERIRALLYANPQGSALVASMLQEERGAAQPDEAADGLERCRRLFDRLVGDNAEASVALYSMGNPALLDAATQEVVALLERLGVLGPRRQVLEIGCGIGRFQQALAGRVAAITGIDIAPGMIAAATRRCAGLPNVRLLRTSGRDLAPFPPASFEAVLAIDVMPYVYRAGMALVTRHFAEVARVLRRGGDFVILNLSYRGDLELDRRDTRRLAAEAGLFVLRNGTTDLRLWDGTTFHLYKPGIGAALSSAG